MPLDVRRPRAAGRPQLARPRGGAPRATGCCAPAAASPAGPTPSSSSATPPEPLAGRRRRRHPLVRRPRPASRGRSCPAPGPARPTRRSPRPAGMRGEDVLVLTAPLASWPAPDVAVRALPRARRRLAGRLPLPRRARCLRRRRPVLTRRRVTPCSPRCGRRPTPAPPAAVARGVVADGWLVISAVDRRRASSAGRGLARAVMAALAAAGRASGARTRACLQVSDDNAPALALYRADGLHRAPPLPLPDGTGLSRRTARHPGRRRTASERRSRRTAGTPCRPRR